jgi:hypothetical protein
MSNQAMSERNLYNSRCTLRAMLRLLVRSPDLLLSIYSCLTLSLTGAYDSDAALLANAVTLSLHACNH